MKDAWIRIADRWGLAVAGALIAALVSFGFDIGEDMRQRLIEGLQTFIELGGLLGVYALHRYRKGKRDNGDG